MVGEQALRRGRDEIEQLADGRAQGAGDRRDPRRLPPRPRRPAARGRDRRPGRRRHRPHRPARGPARHQGLHRPRGPPQLRLLPGRRAQPVRPGRPPPPLQPLRRVTRPLRGLRHRPRPGRPARPGSRPRAAARRPTSSRPTTASPGSARTSRGSTRTSNLPQVRPVGVPERHRPPAAERALQPRRPAELTRPRRRRVGAGGRGEGSGGAPSRRAGPATGR